MLKPASILVFLFISSTLFSLTIDTNDIDASKIKVDFTKRNVTNISLYDVKEREIPNLYLSTGELTYPEIETAPRRFDIVAFISIPISYYITLNLLRFRNDMFYQGRSFDNTDYITMYMNAILIPLFTAYQDYKYLKSQNAFDEDQYGQTYEIGHVDVPKVNFCMTFGFKF